jgi:transcription antitermination factor NusG
VSGLEIHSESRATLPALRSAGEESKWYAIHTRPRNEKWIAGQLRQKEVFTFLPLLQQLHRWSDRRSQVEVPMFSCYAFVRIVQTAEERLKILRTPGVLGFVGSEREGSPIPSEQIENLQLALRKKISCALHPFIRVGQRVRVRGGSLDGMEGILLCEGKDASLIVSVDLLQRSVAIRVNGYDVELA